MLILLIQGGYIVMINKNIQSQTDMNDELINVFVEILLQLDYTDKKELLKTIYALKEDTKHN